MSKFSEKEINTKKLENHNSFLSKFERKILKCEVKQSILNEK